MYSQNKHQVQTIDESKSSMYGSREKVKIELIKGTNLFQVTLIMKMGNGTENCRKAAPYVTDTNEKDGVAKGILRFLSEAEQTLQAENSDKNVKFV